MESFADAVTAEETELIHQYVISQTVGGARGAGDARGGTGGLESLRPGWGRHGMDREIPTEEMLRWHQHIWQHEKPFKDYTDSGGLALRTYRAINWTHRAREESDHFAAFLFFWIAFNSLYDAGDRDKSEAARRRFFEQLADCDSGNRILEALGVFSSFIRRVIDDERAYPFRQQGHVAQVEGAFLYAFRGQAVRTQDGRCVGDCL